MIKKQETKPERIEKLTNAVTAFFNFEDNRRLCQHWDDYTFLSEEKKQSLLAEWRAYYNKVKTDTWHGRMLVQCGRYLATENINAVITVAHESKTRDADYLDKPSGEDPLFLRYKLGGYLARKAELKRLKDEMKNEIISEVRRDLI